MRGVRRYRCPTQLPEIAMFVPRLSACMAAALLFAACAKEAPPPPAAQTAPALASQPQAARNVFEFTIGALPAYALRDGGLVVPNDGRTLAVGQPTETVAKLLAEAGLPTTELSLSIQPLLVKAGERVLLFDTGAGSNMGPGAGKLGASLQEAGVAPASVTDIFISHAHGDHIGGLVSAGALVFPNATVHLTAAEWTYLKAMKEQSAVVNAITPKVDAFKPGSELIAGVVTAVEIKGHTPGHSGYLIGSAADTLLYVGDTVHHSIISVQEPDWTIAFDGDAPVAQKSRKEVLAKYAASGQLIYAVHFPFPGLGKFEKQGERVVWVPER
jgi:glyoxylase-like metal-dependent hydrolase (beta-lactamase superfamily II)